MEFHVANDYQQGFSGDVGSVFDLFSLPRFVYHSEGATGFWDLKDSSQLNDMMLFQLKTTLLYVLREHFEAETENVEAHVHTVLGNYMNDAEELTVTFYNKPWQPVAVEVTDEFVEGKKVATIERGYGDEPNVSEADVEMFDWLYSVYSQGRTDPYGDVDFALSISVRNGRDYVEYSAEEQRYDHQTVNGWMDEQSSESVLSRIPGLQALTGV